MGVLQLGDVTRQELPTGGIRVSARATLPGGVEELFFTVHGAEASACVDPFVPAALLRAMRDGLDLHVDAPVSERFLSSLPTLLDIFCSFEPLYRRPHITAESERRSRQSAGVSAAFFSAGADSFYTVLKHRSELGALLFAHGFDVSIDDHALRRRVAEPIRETARRMGHRLIEIETNLRPFLEQRDAPGRSGLWTMVQGAALAGMSLVVGAEVSRAFIPAGSSYAELAVWGTHPLIDPLWSTELVEVVHDGCEAKRLEKIERIGADPHVHSALRVCFKNIGGEYNCGVCAKCVRTMVELRTVGALDAVTTFAVPLDLDRLRRLPLDRVERKHLTDCWQVLQRRGTDPELERILRKMLANRELLKRATRLIVASIRNRVGGSPASVR